LKEMKCCEYSRRDHIHNSLFFLTYELAQ
jgi:hypothetical protein